MQFFDFNIPYLEDPPAGKTTPSERAARKKSRLKLVVKAVELGYSGIAYNRSIDGVISESDRCSISLFPISSLLSLSPSLSSSASFHRLLLSGAPHSARSPFRQYTRITVSVDNPSQSSALNSGNSILKTYDLVAVRPLNQVAFDQACQFSEVNLISIDFSKKLAFKLKLPMVKAAIARGVYFEITYSGLIEDIQVRRQVISNAKLLVDWTRGKNLIVSSAAPSVLEFRGPNDVANLSSLIGLATEHAKAATSKNCRSLIANTLKKKQFYKEAVRVDRMPPLEQSDPNKPWIIDSMEWDPITSGEGDLLLEDLAKSFSEASKKPKSVKPNGPASSLNNITSTGLEVINSGAETKELGDANKSFTAVKVHDPSSETERIRVCSQRKPLSLFSIPQDHHVDVSGTPRKPFSSESGNDFTHSSNTVASSTASESKLKCSDVPDIGFAETKELIMQEVQNTYSQQSGISDIDDIQQKCKDVEAATEKQNDSEVSAQSNGVNFVSETNMSMIVDDITTESNLQNATGPSQLTMMDLKDQSHHSLFSSGYLIEEALEVKECEGSNKQEALHANDMADLDSGDEGKDSDHSLVRCPAAKDGSPVGDEGKDSDHLLVRCPAAKDGLPVEEMRHTEVKYSKQETDIHLSSNSDGMSYMDPSERINSSSGSLIHDSILHEDSMEIQVDGETHAEANYLSKTTTRSVRKRLQQRGYYRFPFKHLLQVPFKRKAVSSRHRLRKR